MCFSSSFLSTQFRVSNGRRRQDRCRVKKSLASLRARKRERQRETEREREREIRFCDRKRQPPKSGHVCERKCKHHGVGNDVGENRKRSDDD